MNLLRQEWKRICGSSLARNAGWMMAGQGASFILQAIYFVILARLLGVVQYGIFVGAFAFTSIVAQYSTLGAGTVFLRYVSNDRKMFAVYWGNILFVTASAGSLLVICLHFAAKNLLNSSSAALVLLAAIANCLCGQLTAETGRIFQTFEQLRVTAFLNLLTSLVRTLTVMGMLVTLHHASAWQWAVASTSVSALAAAVAVGIVTIRFGRPQFSMEIFRRQGLEGFGYSFAASTTSIYNDVDKTMLSHYGMNFANGIYSVAYRVIDIATMPISSIQAAALPRFFQRGQSSLAEAADLSRQLLKRAIFVGLIATVGMFVAAPLIPMIAGRGFQESVAALRWLCLIPIFRSVHLMTGCALTGAGLQNYRTATQIVAAALNFGLNLWLIPSHGWLGAAWSSLATDAALGIMNWAELKILVMKGK